MRQPFGNSAGLVGVSRYSNDAIGVLVTDVKLLRSALFIGCFAVQEHDFAFDFLCSSAKGPNLENETKVEPRAVIPLFG